MAFSRVFTFPVLGRFCDACGCCVLCCPPRGLSCVSHWCFRRALSVQKSKENAVFSAILKNFFACGAGRNWRARAREDHFFFGLAAPPRAAAKTLFTTRSRPKSLSSASKSVEILKANLGHLFCPKQGSVPVLGDASQPTVELVVTCRGCTAQTIWKQRDVH